MWLANPFALSLAKACSLAPGFDKLSLNGKAGRPHAQAA